MAQEDNNELPVPISLDDQSNRKTYRHLPAFFRTDSNKKFLGGTMDVFTQPGSLTRLSSFVGRRDIPNYSFDDTYIQETSTPRQYYQLEPSYVNENDVTGEVNWYGDYIDYINSLKYFGANVSNHSKLNKAEAYTWNPHVDWDKLANYREYYWLPNGPDPVTIYGELEKQDSEFTITSIDQGDNIGYIFTPDGLTVNPRLTLYRGLTYRFNINTPNKFFSIKTQIQEGDSYFYDIGVSDRKVEVGTIVWTIPYEAPDILYYMDNDDKNTFGIIDIKNIDEARRLDVESEIVGKRTYTNSFGIEFINGLKVKFEGQITPKEYLEDFWYVEGVGDRIKLVSSRNLEAPATFTRSLDVPFDDQGFDSLPFDNADNYPNVRDYLVINRSSRDRNNWSRGNRWFHRNVLETSAKANNSNPILDQESRAIRPIIEFESDLKLFNHGWRSKGDVDLVDTFTTDVFSIIEGSTGYFVDGEKLLPGYRILFTADPDILVKGKIFEVKQILNVNVNADEQITVLSTKASNDTISVTTTEKFRVGQKVQFTGTVVGGLTAGTVYYISPTNFTSTTFSVTTNTRFPTQLVQLTDSAILTMKVSVVSNRATSRKLQLTLQQVEDTDPVEGENVYITKGKVYKGSSFHYTNGEWKISQKKTKYNQAPLFDLFDEELDSFSDVTKYPYNTFSGVNLFRYKVGTGTNDTQLGFPLVYKNINNIGDIEFEFDLQNTSWTYIGNNNELQNLNSTNAFLRRYTLNEKFDYSNGWVKTDRPLEQNAVKILKIEQNTSLIPIDLFNDNKKIYEIEEANRISSLANFYIAKQDSSNRDLNDSQYWNIFDYKTLFKGEWVSTEKYLQEDIVRYRNFIYVCIADPMEDTTGQLPSDTNYWKLLFKGFPNRGDFSRAVSYEIDDIVRFEKNTYICIETNKGLSPTNLVYWKKLIANNSTYLGEFNPNQRYVANDIVSYGLYLYIAKKETMDLTQSKSYIPFDITYWNQLSSGTSYPNYYSKKKLYKTGDIAVFDKRPKLDYRIRVYVNDKKRTDVSIITIEGIVYIKFDNELLINDKVVYKIRTLSLKNLKGYYEIPTNWQNNPFNDVIENFTLGEVTDHVRSIIENTPDFLGDYPGISNLSNLGHISQFGRKFMQHSGSMPLSSYLMIDKDVNLIKALRWNAVEYTQFKKEILLKATTTAFDGSIREIVDDLLHSYSGAKFNEKSPFYFSDTLAYGAASVREYSVVDPRFPVFVIDSVFDITSQKTRAILIYVNEEQILYGKEYEFSTDDTFVTITRPLNIGDKILIKDYSSTDGCYIPATPSSLGLYPLYEPRIYKDDTYLNPNYIVETVVEVDSSNNSFITGSSHNLEIGDAISFKETDIDGVSNKLVYYVLSIIDGNTFTLSKTKEEIDPVIITKSIRVNMRIMFADTSLYKIPDTSVTVIQGHDGSIIKTYGDYRDEVILEIEKRIFNNVRVHYDPKIFNIHDILTGYYRRNDFTKAEINNILLSEFLRWNSISKFDFNSNNYFIDEESFTYNYNQSIAPNGVETLYGYWRGIYKYFYDTDRPHSHPWEIQGFTIKPIWWDDVYGSAPYTSDNKIMWDAIEKGLINDPINKRIDLRYARPGMGNYLPVNDQGILISPLESGLAQRFAKVNSKGRYTFGDQAPVETAWRRSSEYPFSVMILCSILRGSEFIGKMWDRFSIKRNLVGQIYSTITNKKINPKELVFANTISNNTRSITSGLANIIDEYVKNQKNIDHNYYKKTLTSLNVKLAYRLGGFTSKEKIKVLLDSRTPNSSGTIFLPQENYKIFYNKSAPVSTVNYSGVIIEKIFITDEIDGYRIDGYDKERNSFEIFVPRKSAYDPVFNVGGVSENYVEWDTNNYYKKGQIVKTAISEFFRAKINHTSSATFESDVVDKWQKLPFLPLKGGRDAIRRTKFKTDSAVRIPYGTVFTDIQSVVDFLLGYQERLRDWGFEFEQFSKDLELPLNWLTSAKEFMFWTLQKWPSGNTTTQTPGSIITLSPAANYLKFKPTINASVDNLDADFYEYSIFKADGKPLRSDLTNIYREDNGFEIKPASDTKDGIYHIRTNLVYQEHVLLFDNISIFGDVIYDVVPGYRQGRIKLVGFKTNKWDGSYYTPGFMYDNATILDWEPNTDYNMGDVVKYQNYYFTALEKIYGSVDFEYSNWKKLDEKPEPSLISNFDYRVEEFRDYYSLEASNFNTDQQNLARHLTGYQPRQYLENIIVNDVSQYKFYQGFIKEKGTFNSVTKLFDALRASGFSSIDLKEEWAFKVGDFGASDAFTEIEFKLDEEKFVQNPQNVVLTNGPQDFSDSSIYNITKLDTVKKPVSYESKPFKMKSLDFDKIDYGIFKYRTAGYVNPEDVDHIVFDENSLFNYDLTLLNHRDKIWIGNTPNGNWNVMEYFNTKKIIINWERIVNVINLYIDGDISDIQIGNIITIRNLFLLDGIYKVVNVFQNVIQIFTSNVTISKASDDSTSGLLFKFVSVRYPTINNVTVSSYNEAKIRGEKIWIDADYDNSWKVLSNEDVFTERNIIPPTFIRNSVKDSQNGYDVKISENKKYMFVGVINNKNGAVIVYSRPNNTGNWAFLQTIRLPEDFSTITGNEKFGFSIDVSGDGEILVIGVPGMTNIKTKFKGNYNETLDYNKDDVVRYNEKLYRALQKINPDGSTLSITDPLDWELASETYEVTTSGVPSGLNNQGAVFIYKYNQASRRYYERDNYTTIKEITTPLGVVNFESTREQIICSYEPQNNEKFGSKVKLFKDGDNYWLFVTSENYNNGTGRVQVFRRTEDGRWVYNEQWNLDISYDSININYDMQIVEPNYITVYPGTNSRFGYDIAFDGLLLLISAPFLDSGVVYVLELQRDRKTFQIIQVIDRYTINNGFMVNNAGENAFLNDNDYFGYSMSFKNGLLFVTCPNSDLNNTNVGSVYQFSYSGRDSSLFVFTLDKIILPPSFIQNERFGMKVDINSKNDTLAISAAGGNVILDTTFDTYIDRLSFTFDSTRNYELDPNSGVSEFTTTFDNSSTAFFDKIPYTGAVYIFNNFNNTFLYADKLSPIDNLYTGDNFGFSLSIVDDSIVVGAPSKEYNNRVTGMVYVFDYNETSWKVKEKQSELVDIEKFKKAFIYDSKENKLIDNLDFYDPVKGIIPGPAEQEIRYKTMRDPAVYEYTENTEVITDTSQPWSDDHIGELWWDLSNVKWIWYEQGTTTFRNNSWGTIFPGFSIDIYEWVETTLLPSEWLKEVTLQVRNSTISGIPIYTNDITYSTKIKYDKYTGLTTTYYYYWVKNRTTVPRVNFRSIPAADVAQLIADPAAVGYKFIAITSNSSFSLFNIESNLKDTQTHLNVQFYEIDNTELLVHREYALLAEDDPTTVIPSLIENKWFDSLIGYNERGQPVPDTRLSWRERFGSSYEPRQSWFVNRFEALKQYFEYVNLILKKNQIVDNINFTKLKTFSPPPVLNQLEFADNPCQIDQIVDIEDDLRFISILKLATAKVSPTIIDGKIVSVSVTNPGYGYKTPPSIKILGIGTGAKLKTIIDSSGRVVSVIVIKTGQNYEDIATTLKVRNYSVLVQSDESSDGRWSVYDWSGDTKKRWNRIRTQAYNVSRYWNYVDWYAQGYDINSEIGFQVERTVDLYGILAEIGDVVKVNNVNGSWLLLKRKSITETPDYIDDYEVIGRQNATIEFSDKLYNLNKDLGYDIKFSYDLNLYDQTPTVELRIILKAIRDDILTDDLRIEYIKLFFNNINYALNENLFVDWVFKTSFLRLNHNVGTLKQRITFQSDELPSYQQYIEEIKPYKSKIREFLDSYQYIDPSYSQTTDFDLFSSYNYSTKQIERTTVNTINIETYPWKSWSDNHFYEITEIEVYDQGDGYISRPKVIITGDGRDASAIAYIAKGKVYKIVVDNPGFGYSSAPIVYISGGIDETNNRSVRAKAIAKIGNCLVRTNNLSIKYDRISPTVTVDNLQYVDTFKGTGKQKRFKLTYAPDPKKINFNILVNNIEVYGSAFDVEIVETLHDTYKALEGYVVFATAPSAPITSINNIRIEYDKNIRLFDAADRIEKSYNPTTGMYGKELGQLMTGVDYGGVQLTSIDFEIGGGWDVLPWENSSWDNVITTNDDYVIKVDTDSTHSWNLPYVPARGEVINVYINDIRVDDPYFNLYDGSTPQENGLYEAPTGIIMNSFVGDGFNNEILIPYSYEFVPNTYITFRKSTSDGTILPTDRSLLDTFVEGGDLAYSTAKGINAEEIIIDGDGFVTLDTSHGPEELVQGQVVDTLEINVYHAPSDGGPNVLVKNYTGDGITKTFDVGHKLTTTSGIIVILNDKLLINVDDSTSVPDNDYNHYKVNFKENTITLSNIPAQGDKLSIVSIDTAGYDISEKISFVGDGSTTSFLTGSRYDNGDISGFVTINGVSTDFNLLENISQIKVPFRDIIVGRKYRIIDSGTEGFETDFRLIGAADNSPNTVFTSTSDGSKLTGNGTIAYNVTGNAIISFDEAPADGDIINIIVFKGTVTKWSEITTQDIPINYNYGNNKDQIQYEYPLNPLPAVLGPLSAMAFVIIDNKFLQAPDYEHYIYDGNYLQINDLRYLPRSLKPQDIDVYRAGNKLTPIKDYTLNSELGTVTLVEDVAQIGDEITIEIYKFADFRIDVKGWDGSSFTQLSVILSPSYLVTTQQMMRVITFTNHDIVKIKTSNVGFRFNTGYDVLRYDIVQFDILSTSINTSGIFNLPRTVGNTSGVFVALNRRLLAPNVDYVVLDNKNQIKVLLPDILSGSDYIQIITFNDKTVQPSYGFKIFKDMMNRYSYKRLDDSTTTKLLQDLTYLDTRIVVENANVLPTPNRSLNLPGVIEIDGERIEYLVKEGNVLRQLRRGTLGTGIKTFYSVDTLVKDFGVEQTIPYSDKEMKKTYYGDKSTQMFELDFVPINNGVVNYFKEFGYVYKSSYNELYTYSTNDVVVFEGSYFVAQNTTIGNTPVVGDNWVFWSDIVDSVYPYTISSSYEGIYSSDRKYYSGDYVKYKGSFYECKKDGTGKIPGKDIEYWILYNLGVDVNWYRSTIPDNYGQCDEIEVFVAGRRLRKNPITVYDQSLGQDSYNGAGDKIIEAEFSVDGINNRVRLTEIPQSGQLVVIVRKNGRIWQNADETNSLVFSPTSIARFLRAKQVNLPR